MQYVPGGDPLNDAEFSAMLADLGVGEDGKIDLQKFRQHSCWQNSEDL